MVLIHGISLQCERGALSKMKLAASSAVQIYSADCCEKTSGSISMI